MRFGYFLIIFVLISMTVILDYIRSKRLHMLMAVPLYAYLFLGSYVFGNSSSPLFEGLFIVSALILAFLYVFGELKSRRKHI